jgi:tetratricopeptide (TPR) repeat protein
MSWRDNDSSPRASENSIQSAISREIVAVLPRCDVVLRRYTFFNIAFLILGGLELLLLLYFLRTLSDSALFSVALAGIFLTLFGYFLLKAYWQTSKNQKLVEIKKQLVEQLREILNYQPEHPESHIALSQALCRLAENLKGREHSLYRATKRPTTLGLALEKICHWLHWQDFHSLRERALEAAVEEQIKRVKCEPTDPEAHAALANNYILLSSLYADHSEEENGFWDPMKNERSLMQKKFRDAAERAVEELKILSNYAPSDPWIHEQLAYSYKDLQMPDEEIKEYELVLRLVPDDTEVLYKLGVLYFQQGKNVQGLHMYERLKHSHPTKAEVLIQHYGAYSTNS